MAKFLIGVWPWPGHYFPLIAIAHRLCERGHEVAFYSGLNACPTIEGEGFRCFPFVHIDEAEFGQLLDSRDSFASAGNPINTRNLMRQWLVGTLPGQVADLSDILDRWQPDCIIAETAMWAPALILRETRPLPIAVFSTVAACLLPGPDAPPFGLGLPNRAGLPGRLGRRVATVVADLLAADMRRAANKVLRSYGLPPLTTSVTAYCGQMPLYLMPSVPEFDYRRHDLPPSVHYVGPCLWNKAKTEDMPAWLSSRSSDQPLVHVSEGTKNSQQPLLLRAAAQGLADLPMEVIMTAGGNRDPESLELGPLAGNIRLVSWVAHTDILPRTDVLVTTGGAGTVMTALQFGVPLVIVPTEWDKPDNAQRVVEARVGVRLNPRRCTPGRLRAAVQEVLRNPMYRRNAENMRSVMQQYDGPTLAVILLEELIMKREPAGVPAR